MWKALVSALAVGVLYHEVDPARATLDDTSDVLVHNTPHAAYFVADAITEAAFELWNADTDTKIANIETGARETIMFAWNDIYNASGIAPIDTSAPFPNINVVARFSPVDYVQFALSYKSAVNPNYFNDSYRIERETPYSLCGKSGATDLLSCAATESMEWGGRIFVGVVPYKTSAWSRLFPLRFPDKALPSSGVSFVLVPNCPAGYVQAALRPQPTGLCVDVNECTSNTTNECTTSSPTFNASCINTQGSYECTCPYGFVGTGRNGNCTLSPCFALRDRTGVTCADCVEVGCGWTSPVGKCRLADCKNYFNSVCYDLQTNLSNYSIRTARTTSAITGRNMNTSSSSTTSHAICRQQSDCWSCTETKLPNNGNSPNARNCHWYQRGTGKGCGICGLDPCHDDYGCGGKRTCPRRRGLFCILFGRCNASKPVCD